MKINEIDQLDSWEGDHTKKHIKPMRNVIIFRQYRRKEMAKMCEIGFGTFIYHTASLSIRVPLHSLNFF
jgi:hypothetical protein